MSHKGTILKASVYQFFPPPLREVSDEPPAIEGADFVQADWTRNDKPLTIARGWQFYIHERCRRLGQSINRVCIIARYTCDFFGLDAQVEQIRREKCAAYTDWRFSQGASILTVRKELGIYRAMVSHNFKYDRVVAVPYIERPEGQGKKRRALTEEEYRKVLALPISYRLRLFLHIAGWTGHRKRAIETLPWTRVDLDENRIINFNDPTMRLTKKRRVDGFPIPEELHRRLVAAKARAAVKCPDDPYVIGMGRARDGKTPCSVSNELKAALRKIGIDERGVLCHAIRKMFVTERIKAGKNPEKVAALIGDNAQTMRKHYSMLTTNDLRDTAELARAA